MFSKRLKELRELLNLNKKELAEIMGVSSTTIASYESGHREPNFIMLNKLANFFNVSLDYLLGRTDDKNNNIVKDDKKESDEYKEYIVFIQEMKDKGINIDNMRKMLSIIKMMKEVI